jgi:GrpB-like predicted nucleotidyltransferase (UPF0157 family)
VRSAFLVSHAHETWWTTTPLIEIVGYREEWPVLFRAERDRLEGRIGDHVVAIEHFGSTSVPGLAAKPIIDICPVVPDMDAARACKPAMLDSGYRFNAEREDWLAFERRDDAGQQYNVHFHPSARPGSNAS